MKQSEYIAAFIQEVDLEIAGHNGDPVLSASAYLDIADLAPALDKANWRGLIERMETGTGNIIACAEHRARVMMAIAHRIANRRG